MVALPVKEKPSLTKSMMASKNLPRPITKTSEGPHWLRVLAAELALRLNELRETDLSVWPKTIVLHARHRMMIPHLDSLRVPHNLTRERT
jgi:DNA polymerase eta